MTEFEGEPIGSQSIGANDFADPSNRGNRVVARPRVPGPRLRQGDASGGARLRLRWLGARFAETSKAKPSTAARISLPKPRPWKARPARDPLPQFDGWRSPSRRSTASPRFRLGLVMRLSSSRRRRAAAAPVILGGRKGRTRAGGERGGLRRRASHRGDGCRPWRGPAVRGAPQSACISADDGASRRRPSSTRPCVSEGLSGSGAVIGARRYTPPMGVVETMED